MAQIRVQTLASALRELRKTIKIVPFDTDVSEESVRLQTQKTIDGAKWGVSAIETWCKTEQRTVNTDQIWNRPIYVLDGNRDGTQVALKYFMDGIQRTTPIGTVRFRKSSYEAVPIHFAQIAITLLKRENRTLAKQDEEIRLLIEYPNDFVRTQTDFNQLHDDILGNLKTRVGGAIEAVDTSYRIARLKETERASSNKNSIKTIDGIEYPMIDNSALWDWCSDPAQFRSQARRWTTRYRDIAEQKVYDNALDRFGSGIHVGKKYELVVKDGPLTHVRGGVTRAALGVIKTFRTLFLERSQMTKVLSLPYGYRSPVFTLTRPVGNPEEDELYDYDTGPNVTRNRLISWYLRIRPIGRHDPTWGLLRLEMHIEALPCQGHSGRWISTDTYIIDEISRQLCYEANPSAHPDPRWHNLIYPVKCCEGFLRSRILPHVTARYLLGGT